MKTLRAVWVLSCLAVMPVPAASRITLGMASNGSLIEADLAGADLPSRARILLIGGMDGSKESSDAVYNELNWFEATSRERNQYLLAAITRSNPAGAKLAFPPAGDAYRDNAESHVLWRWMATWTPDLVIVVGADPGGLVTAMLREAVAGVGRIPVQRVDAKRGILAAMKAPAKSPARLEAEKRLARTPRQVAVEMGKVYGHDLAEAVYIPAVAVMARLRMGHLDDVERIVEPYFKDPKKSLLKATGSHLSGHLLFADLAMRTGKPEYTAMARAAADLGFTESGQMRESMPYHNQMSDSVFMGCPILVKAGQLTGDRKYYDMALRHFRFMRNLDERSDGLWRHSPKDEAAWGRGNGFAALGMALSLLDLPEDHPAHAEMLASFRTLVAALGKHQDVTGMWRQVVDHPGAYRELTATCMIAYSISRAIRRGWLDVRTYRPMVDHAWDAVKIRVASNGGLMDVCEGTGAQASLNDYLKRKAILGRDPRGGAMVLLFATEMAGLE